jgi:hypothetical protein
MRLGIALSALAGGLLVGLAGNALAADAPPPPTVPIFYCPTAPTAQAAAPTPGPAPRVARAAYHHRIGCPSSRRTVAMDRHEWRGRPAGRLAEGPPPPPFRGPPPYPPGPPHVQPPMMAMRAPGGDVSASQAFIYRYERALHGLDARAAEQAWAHANPGGPPIPPPPPPHVQPPAYAYSGGGPPHVQPPPGYSAPPMAQRETWGQEGYAQGGPPSRPPPHAQPPYLPPPPPYAEAPPMPPAVHVYVHPAAPPRPYAQPSAGYAWNERAGAGYAYEQRESERESGWSYSNVDGHVHTEHWGDHDRGHGGPCPPSPRGCSAGAQGGGWRDGSYGAVYRTTGRDASGYLVWPGKTPDQ